MIQANETAPSNNGIFDNKMRNGEHLRRLEDSKHVNMECKLQSEKSNEDKYDRADKSSFFLRESFVHMKSIHYLSDM